MPAFFQADRDQVIGGAARFLWQETLAEHGSAVSFPTKIDDIIDVVSYKARQTNGWRDFGQTSDGITITRNLTLTTWDTDQVPEVYEAVDRWTHLLASNIAEVTLENFQAAWEAGTIVPVVGGLPGERRLSFGIPSTLTERRLAVVFKDHHGYFWAWIFRRAALNTVGDTVYNRGVMQLMPATFKLYPDPDIDDENDQICRVHTNAPATTSTSTTSTSTTTTSTSTSTTQT